MQAWKRQRQRQRQRRRGFPGFCLNGCINWKLTKNLRVAQVIYLHLFSEPKIIVAAIIIKKCANWAENGLFFSQKAHTCVQESHRHNAKNPSKERTQFSNSISLSPSILIYLSEKKGYELRLWNLTDLGVRFYPSSLLFYFLHFQTMYRNGSYLIMLCTVNYISCALQRVLVLKINK